MKNTSVAVVGAGIIGAATAALLTERGHSVTVFEKEQSSAAHQTGHNSGVVHAGLYYEPGSLKARLTRRGVELLREYCERRGVAYQACGKLVVAHRADQIERLNHIAERARANGVPGIEIVDAERIREIEPNSVGIAAVHSPSTAIVDYPGVTRSLLDDVVLGAGELRFGDRVTRVTKRGCQHVVESERGGGAFDYVIVCGGLQSDRIAKKSGADPYPAIVPFYGDYFELAADKTHLVNGLLYPVPDPAYPFLGVHLTRMIDGRVTVGPNAFLSFAREGYTRWSLNIGDLWQTSTSTAFWRFASQNMRAAREQIATASKRSFVEGAQEFVPEIEAADMRWGGRGIRAQAMNRDGSLLDDFAIERIDNAVFVRNAPSPAATSSLAIAEHIVEQMLLQ